MNMYLEPSARREDIAFGIAVIALRSWLLPIRHSPQKERVCQRAAGAARQPGRGTRVAGRGAADARRLDEVVSGSVRLYGLRADTGGPFCTRRTPCCRWKVSLRTCGAAAARTRANFGSIVQCREAASTAL